MKRLSLIIPALFLLACSTSEPKITANIAGTLGDQTLNGEYAYLSDYNSESRERIDSTLVEDGKFNFKTKIDTPTALRVDIARKYANILVENSNPITVDIDRSTRVKDNGGSNDLYRESMMEIDEKVTFIQQILKELIDQCGFTYDEAIEREQPFKKIIDIYSEHIYKNRDNMAGVMLLWGVANIANGDSAVKSLIDSLPQSKEFAPIANAYKLICNTEATAEGCQYADFEGTNLTGESVKLSDYLGKGKYVLVDFWASWCGPCMGEVPNLKEAYTKYSSDELTIVGVNVWDKADKFAKAVEEEAMEWQQIHILGNTATELYGINSIPQIMLIAPNGTILKRNLRGPSITKAIDAALSK